MKDWMLIVGILFFVSRVKVVNKVLNDIKCPDISCDQDLTTGVCFVHDGRQPVL